MEEEGRKTLEPFFFFSGRVLCEGLVLLALVIPPRFGSFFLVVVRNGYT